MTDRRVHWDDVYSSKAETEVSWYQENPAPSLELITLAGADETSAIIDIGGGASRLVDALLAKGYTDLTVLDISASALAAARTRLGEAARHVEWIVADATTWEPTRQFDVWHDRAAFHFLTDDREQAAYVARLARGLRVGGHAIIGTFAPDGPEKCSGLPVARHDAASLAAILGPAFEPIDSRRIEHATPWQSIQKFQFTTFRRIA